MYSNIALFLCFELWWIVYQLQNMKHLSFSPSFLSWNKIFFVFLLPRQWKKEDRKPRSIDHTEIYMRETQKCQNKILCKLKSNQFAISIFTLTGIKFIRSDIFKFNQAVFKTLDKSFFFFQKIFYIAFYKEMDLATNVTSWIFVFDFLYKKDAIFIHVTIGIFFCKINIYLFNWYSSCY